MLHFVVFQVLLGAESFEAHFTFVWFDPQMYQLVTSQMCRSEETHLALVTFMWLLSLMNPHVLYQVVRTTLKLDSTHLTLDCVTCMPMPLVTLKASACKESFVTIFAFIFLFPTVTYNMLS